MAGCFGNSPYDRYVENELFRYLDELDDEEYDRKREEQLQRLYEEAEWYADQENDKEIEKDWEELEKDSSG